MDCGEIDGDVLDEIALGRMRDPAVSAHMAQCRACSARLFRHLRLVADLRVALGADLDVEDDNGMN